MFVSLHVRLVTSVYSFCSAPQSVSLRKFPHVSRKCFKCTGVYFFIIFQREKGLVSFSYVLFCLSRGVSPICKIGGVLRQDLLSLCPHPLSLYHAPKAPGVFIEQCLPPALTTAAQKTPLETLLHPNEAILWGSVMVRHPTDPLGGGTISSFVKRASPLSHVHWYSLDETHSNFCFFLFFTSSDFFQRFTCVVSH